MGNNPSVSINSKQAMQQTSRVGPWDKVNYLGQPKKYLVKQMNVEKMIWDLGSK